MFSIEEEVCACRFGVITEDVEPRVTNGLYGVPAMLARACWKHF